MTPGSCITGSEHLCSKGEILGIAGVSGIWSNELAEILAVYAN
jgi:ABC-type uncharacterized transport system ATPase subunit